MFDRILFPTDGSEGSEVALDHVLDLADTFDSTVHLLNVADTSRDSIVQIHGDVVDVLEREGEQIVEQAAESAMKRRIDTVTEVLQGNPYSTIIDYANSREIDLVVMPTHGRRGLERFLLGSVTERVVRQSEVPVLTIRPNGEATITYPYEDVLVPTDGSDSAREALSRGVDVSLAEGATLHILSVIVRSSLGADVRTDIQREALSESANNIVEDAVEYAENAGVESVLERVEYGSSIHEAILSYIEEADIGLVVVGTRGRTGFDRYMLGSVTEYLIRTSPIPVLTVREQNRDT